ncbi:helicase [Bifidobacterium sp. ESL0798]|uniref:helicase n=1 Tax=unclassified Bifidobacterium TaxID=2608897 RepID=UPI0023F997FF|nr:MULTISPECIES: helicase [unclassified Bifidobacterium]WEV52672.1 helicase [Bifidobacterium sp. ESL0704]WEV74355.1 helicase [Bifidobacterium sp. ESL0798]
MSETNQTMNGIQRMRKWYDSYRNGLMPSPLEDVGQLTAQLDLTHAHPSGIAQLFASGHTTLDSMFRDAGMLRAAGRRLERVLDDKAVKTRSAGVAELSLVVGVATWKGNSVPVLLYPVEVRRKPGGRETDAVIRFTGHVSMNPAFTTAMHDQRLDIDEVALFDGRNYASGTPDTSSVFSAITDEIKPMIADFDIERNIILGCFMDPATKMLAESRHIIDALAGKPSGNTALDALAGNADAISALKDTRLPSFSPFDADPHSEHEAGDVDNVVRYAANMAAQGHSLFVDVASGNDTAQISAAVASRCISAGRTVLYVPAVAGQKKRFVHEMETCHMGGRVVDMADSQAASQIDKELIAAVGFKPGAAVARFDQVSDELVGVRSRLTRYLGDLHGVSSRWGVSAYQTIQNLASISAMPTHPATHVRLSNETARAIAPHMDEWIKKLRKAGEYGEFTVGPQTTAWYGASLFTQSEAVNAYQKVENLLQRLLPATRDQVASVAETCGFPVPSTAQEWGRQVTVLKNLRRVLDVFQPRIFERDIDSMIEASKPKAQRKAEGTSMGFWERRRHVKEAKSLLRAGSQVEDLHEALQVVDKQSQQWHDIVPHGGWPVLPAKLDTIVETQEALMRDITALDTVLATTVEGGDLQSVDLARLETRLKALYSDRNALDTLPGRASLERDFHSMGLDALIEDMRNRRVSVDAVEGELQLSWWTTVFEDIVRSSAIISNQDGSALQSAADRFVQVDVDHVNSVGPMLDQEAMRHLCDMLFSHTQEANQLHTLLASNRHVPLSRIAHEYSQILAAAKPVIMATPFTLAVLSGPEPLADVAIIDAASHLPSLELLSILSRARRVVVIAHQSTITSESMNALVALLPKVTLETRPVCRDPRLSLFLSAQGYGGARRDVATESMQGRVRFHRIEANGVPVLATGLVESSQQEIDEVIAVIKQRAGAFTVVPTGYLLAVVTLTPVFRTRLGAELKSLSLKDEAMGRFLRHVRLVDLDEAAGVRATDVILSLCFAKTSHGRLLQQFGTLEGEGGGGKLLDALALANRNVDIISAFGSEDMEDDRLHQPGPKLLKVMLKWAEGLGKEVVRPSMSLKGDNVLFNDLADRIRARGLKVAANYGFDGGASIPLVVGLKDKPFSLAVMTDDAHFMGIQSTRKRHRVLMQELATLGWSVMTVWSVAAFVNPDKEVDRIVSRISDLYQEVR